MMVFACESYETVARDMRHCGSTATTTKSRPAQDTHQERRSLKRPHRLARDAVYSPLPLVQDELDRARRGIVRVLNEFGDNAQALWVVAEDFPDPDAEVDPLPEVFPKPETFTRHRG